MSARRLASVGLVAAQLLGCDTRDTPAAPPQRLPGTAQGASRAPLSAGPKPQEVREDLERALAERINEARRVGVHCGSRGNFGPAPGLELSAELGRAARAHAANMADQGFFQHVDPAGHDSRERALAQGFRGRVGEDLAWGQPTPAQVLAAWLQSPGHCGTLMSASYTHLGIGYAEGARGKPLWVLLVGQPLTSARTASSGEPLGLAASPEMTPSR